MTETAKFYPLGDLKKLLDEPAENAKKNLAKMLEDTNNSNRQYIEWIFSTLRTDHPYLDSVMVSHEGRVVEMWSTLLDYAQDKQQPPTLEQILSRVQKDRKMYFMITPQKNSFIFYDEELEKKLLELGDFKPQDHIQLRKSTGGALKIKKAYIKSPVNNTYNNEFTPAQLRQAGLVLGRLGYWPRPSSFAKKNGIGFTAQQPKEPTTDSYIIRVIINKHPEAGYVYLSPLKMTELLEDGMLPMSRHGPHIKRVEVAEFTKDMIANFMLSYGNDPKVNMRPLVLRYNAYRPWEGDLPKHNGSRK